MAYEMKDQMRPEDGSPSSPRIRSIISCRRNPWVPVGWRTRENDRDRSRADFRAQAASTSSRAPVTKLVAEENTLELDDGSTINYDYLIIATGPELAFDEIEGFGPEGYTNSICHIDHAEKAAVNFEEFCKKPGPDRHRRGAGRLLLRSGL